MEYPLASMQALNSAGVDIGSHRSQRRWWSQSPCDTVAASWRHSCRSRASSSWTKSRLVHLAVGECAIWYWALVEQPSIPKTTIRRLIVTTGMVGGRLWRVAEARTLQWRDYDRAERAIRLRGAQQEPTRAPATRRR